jgi:acyl-coenzyme A thioesterase PaaI-like protein
MGPPEETGLSSVELAQRRGDSLPGTEVVTPGALALVDAVRRLSEVVVVTGADDARRADAARRLRAISDELAEPRRSEAVLLIRHGDGRLEHLTQAGSGRLNPQAPPIWFDPFPTPPPPGAEPQPVELVAHCTFSAAHGGPPGRAHGGVVAALLDEVIGYSAFVAGAPGMSVSLSVRFRSATPREVPLEVRARLTRWEGRKRWATGEVLADGRITAEGECVIIAGSAAATPETPAGRA